MSASEEARRRNRRLAVGAVGSSLSMGGLTYAAAPFYTAFCRATGYQGTPQIATADATSGAGGRCASPSTPMSRPVSAGVRA